MNNDSILIVEDESVVALDLKLQLQDLGYAVAGIAASADEALSLARLRRPDLVLMDVRLQGPRDGVDAAAELRRSQDLPVIFLTSHSDSETVQRAARTAPYGFLTKPYQIRELSAGIQVALTKARMERQLREADRWFAHTLNCVQDGVVVTEADATVRFVNPAAEAITGWTLDEARGSNAAEVVRFDDPAMDVLALVRRVVEDGRPGELALGRRLQRRGGEGQVVDVSAGPVHDDAGYGLGAVLVLHDARARLSQEAQLRASEERFRSAFDFAPLGMALLSLTGEFVQVNDSLCRMLGLERQALMARPAAALTVEDDRAHEAERLKALLRNEGPVCQFEKRYLRGDGSVLWTLVSVSALLDGDRPGCYLYQIHDLTEQKAAAEQLAELAAERLKRQASEMANSAKSAFLSRVSHEMRTPLNAVMGFAQLLKLEPSPEPTQALQYADHILSAGHHLLALVNDLLDLQRVAQGSLQLHIEAVDLQAAAQLARSFLERQAQAQGIEIQTQIAIGLRARADAVRLRQVLLNVTSNAVKYNRPGGRVTLIGEPGGSGRALLRVEDTGIGMTPAQMARLFQPFDRLGQERGRTPGVGLGLLIARDLVQDMGGMLVVESEPSTGTRVLIDLPRAD